MQYFELKINLLKVGKNVYEKDIYYKYNGDRNKTPENI